MGHTLRMVSTRRPSNVFALGVLIIMTLVLATRELQRMQRGEGSIGFGDGRQSASGPASAATDITASHGALDDELRQILQVGEPTTSAEDVSASEGEPRVCVVVRTYRKQFTYLPLLLGSLAHGGQRVGKVSAFVIDTENEPGNHLERLLDWHNGVMGQPSFSRALHFTDSKANASRPDWGYAKTDKALAFFKRKLMHPEESHEGDQTQCDYLLFTNGDNFYTTGWYKVLLPLMKAQKDMIASDFISRYESPPRIDRKADNRYVFDDMSRKRVETMWQVGEIDLGCIFFNLQFMIKQKLWFRSSAIDGYTVESDGDLAVKARRKSRNHAITRQVLFVHQ